MTFSTRFYNVYILFVFSYNGKWHYWVLLVVLFITSTNQGDIYTTIVPVNNLF